MASTRLSTQLVIGVRRVLERNATLAADIDRCIDIGRTQRDVLDALALVFAEEFLDLALVVLDSR